jgi:diacylglycerol kinase family enzyme
MKPGELVTLIVNPAAGRAGLLRAQLPAMEVLLQSKGLRMRVRDTSPAQDSAKQLAADAAVESSLVIACGGDGTVHGVIQGMAHTGTPFGVLPLGTANALARNLKLPLDPVAALRRLITYEAVQLPLGEIGTASCTRVFLVMAGCGPDGALVHALASGSPALSKRGLGRNAYYLHAARLFLTRRWPHFSVEFHRCGSTEWQRTQAVAVLSSRVPDLGGMFTGLTPRAALRAPHLHLHILRPPAQLSFAAWFSLSRVGIANPLLLSVDVDEVRCSAEPRSRVYAQADAEPVGGLPLHMRIVPDALRLLMPPTMP